jgi:hypothetical protein
VYEKLDASANISGVNLQKAFDSVRHDILLAKMNICGVRGIGHERFKGYLAERKQCSCVLNMPNIPKSINDNQFQSSICQTGLQRININKLEGTTAGEQKLHKADHSLKRFCSNACTHTHTQ